MDDQNVPDFLKIRQMLAQMPGGQTVASNVPTFDQMPSPLQRGPSEDVPQAAAPPRPQMKPAAPAAEESNDHTPEASDAPEKSDSLAGLRVTKDDLDDAARKKKMILGLGQLGDDLASQQSWGNFRLGHLNPHADSSAYTKQLASLADQPIQQKQTLLKQALEQPKQDMGVQAADPNSAISKTVGAATIAVMKKSGLPTDGMEGMSALQVNEFLDKNPVIKEAVTQDNAMKKLTAVLAQQSIANGIRERSLGVREDAAASKAGNAFEDNSIIKGAKGSLNSLSRSVGILDNTSKPVTTNDLNLAYTDYINAVANGGAATDGKIKRELPETFEGDWNTLKGKVGQFDDLRQSQTGQKLIDMLKNNMSHVQGDLNKAISDQAKNTATSYGSTSNQKVKDTVAGKLKTYAQPDKKEGDVGGPAQMSQEDKDALAYVNSHPNDKHNAGILTTLMKKYPGQVR